MVTREPITWPAGKTFAFSVFDDTDLASLERLVPVYDLLADLGFRTTKSVWPILGEGTPRVGGATCDDPDYLAWTLRLQASGFEIGSHGASSSTSTRPTTIRAMERFRELYGHTPHTLSNHSGCFESIYWGPERVTGSSRVAYNAMTRFRWRGSFRGHVEGDPLFWGDVCQANVRYVRNFTFADVDTLKSCPMMPYHDPARPYVQAWFASSEGRNLRSYNACLSEANLDRLEERGGACIVYTHFASGFVEDGRVDARFTALMRRLAQMNGWFVPVATLLDHIVAQRGITTISPRSRLALERRWLASKARVGRT